MCCGKHISDLIDDGRHLDICVGNAEFRPKKDSYRTVSLRTTPSEYLLRWEVVRLGHGADKKSPMFVSVRRGDHATTERL